MPSVHIASAIFHEDQLLYKPSIYMHMQLQFAYFNLYKAQARTFCDNPGFKMPVLLLV